MRKKDVDSIIQHINEKLEKIEVQYNDALKKANIESMLQIEIKNIMENLRSILDYLAHDIYDLIIKSYLISMGKSELDKIYFPYGRTENDFKSGVGSNLPNLNTLSPQIFELIEGVQSYKIDDTWLIDLCSTVNDNKHDKLTPQKRVETKELKIDFGGGAGIKMGPGASITGTGYIGTDSGGIYLQNSNVSNDSPAQNVRGDVNQEIIKWVSFKFEDTNIEVFPLLKKSFVEIEKLSNKIYEVI